MARGRGGYSKIRAAENLLTSFSRLRWPLPRAELEVVWAAHGGRSLVIVKSECWSIYLLHSRDCAGYYLGLEWGWSLPGSCMAAGVGVVIAKSESQSIYLLHSRDCAGYYLELECVWSLSGTCAAARVTVVIAKLELSGIYLLDSHDGVGYYYELEWRCHGTVLVYSMHN